MSEPTTEFQSLPDEYQHVIRLAQENYGITVAPLQLLVGGWSGAIVYLVSVSTNDSGRVEHCILKLDRKGKSAKSDEVTRHNAVMSKSTPDFARDHIAELVFDRVEHEGAIAIFYRIAGQSLLKYRPLSSYGQESQLKTIFAQTNSVLLTEWNGTPTFEQAVHPQKVLENWLGFRLEPGGNTEHFLQNVCRVDPDIPGFLINGNVFPNPLAYARKPEHWGKARPIDIVTGLIHGDLNTNNILVKFSDDKENLEGYYLIDFALFKEGMPLLYDQRYLEMSYLIYTMSQISFAKCVELIAHLAEVDTPDPHKAPIEMAGATAVIASARSAFAEWAKKNHPSMHDDLWGQYWLAGAAAGLSYCHKAGQSDENRLVGLIYAAANLKRYAALFSLPAPTEVKQLYDENRFRVSTGQGSLTALSAIDSPHHNLPAQPTPFIGRGAQVASIKDLLMRPDVRLVTLLGPGGTGKTRLSLQVAQELLDDFPDGVFFVPLADDTDSNQFVSRVAQQLGVKEGGRPLLENLKDFLREKHLLLVLDNFEQLMSAAQVVADLLAGASQLKIITSSRIALNLHGEREFPVPPLDLPTAASDVTAEELAGNESILLFTQRAQATQPSFALTDENAPAIAQICRRLDGLPLALELAAARVKLLPPKAILVRLDDKLKLLTGGARDLPARHQTLRNTLEWSYGLLDQSEKTLYARLGVFVGGFTLEAAEAICNLNGSLDILQVVTSLVNNSLLRQETLSDGEPRFSMLETIREYALERLGESGELEAMREQHAKYFVDIILNKAGNGLFSPNAMYWLNWLERENDNVRATLAWSLASPQGAEYIGGLIFALNWYWYRRGYFIEGRMWSEKTLALPTLQAPSAQRALALHCGGILAVWLGKQDTGLAELQEGLGIGLRLEDGFIIAGLQAVNGVALVNMGRDGDAQTMLEQAKAFFKEHSVTYLYLLTLVHAGNAELGLGKPEKARAYHEAALIEARALGEAWVLTFTLTNLGEVARTLGHYDEARIYYEESEALLRTSGDRGDMARLVHNLGYIALHEGDNVRAESQFRESLVMFRQLGNRRGIAECLAALGGLKTRQGEAKWGAEMLGAAQTLLQATGGAWWPADRVEVELSREIMQSALGDDEFTSAWKAGQSMTLEQAITFASNDIQAI